MKSLIEKLYDGEICPSEEFTKSERYYQKFCEHTPKYDEFMQKLKTTDESLTQDFVAVIDDQLELLSVECSEAFIYGFRLGARLMAEIFQDNSSENSCENK